MIYTVNTADVVSMSLLSLGAEADKEHLMLYTARYIPIAAAQDANSHPPRLVKQIEISHIS